MRSLRRPQGSFTSEPPADTSQNPGKQFLDRFSCNFGSLFGHVLARFWYPFCALSGAVFAAFLSHFLARFSCIFCSLFEHFLARFWCTFDSLLGSMLSSLVFYRHPLSSSILDLSAPLNDPQGLKNKPQGPKVSPRAPDTIPKAPK